jgi:hypothetical protein
VLAVVHDPTDRRVGLASNFDKIQSVRLGSGKCLTERQDAQLLVVRSYHPDFLAAIEPVPVFQLLGDWSILLWDCLFFGATRALCLLARCAGDALVGLSAWSLTK